MLIWSKCRRVGASIGPHTGIHGTTVRWGQIKKKGPVWPHSWPHSWPNTGFLMDILIEAQRASDRPGVKGMYLSTFEGHGDLQCAWVRESGMSKDAKDWWRLGSELPYPGYSEADYPCYDDKQNPLGHSLSSDEFLRCLWLSLTYLRLSKASWH